LGRNHEPTQRDIPNSIIVPSKAFPRMPDLKGETLTLADDTNLGCSDNTTAGLAVRSRLFLPRLIPVLASDARNVLGARIG
jgi:hypothetical protein